MGQIKYNNLDDLFYIKGEYFLEKEKPQNYKKNSSKNFIQN